MMEVGISDRDGDWLFSYHLSRYHTCEILEMSALSTSGRAPARSNLTYPGTTEEARVLLLLSVSSLDCFLLIIPF